jgi:hypothetical protein
VLAGQRLADQRDDTLGIDHVRGEEGLHLGGDPGDRRRRAVGPERGRDVVGDRLQGLGAEVQREQEVLLGSGHLARDAEPAGIRGLELGLHTVGVDLVADVRLAGRRRVGEDLEQRSRDLGLVA